MSDWDFLYEMKDLGYSEGEIEEARSSGAAPWEWDWIEEQDQLSIVFRKLLDIMEELHNGKQDWIAFADINSALRKQGVRIEEYQYKKFKPLMLEAEQQGFCQIRQNGHQWDAKLS